MKLLLKNSAGQKSASFTMMIVSYSVVTLWLLVSIISKIGHIEIRPFSGSEAMAYLAPILALYWGRRSKEAKEELNKAVATPVEPASPSASEQ